VVQCLRNVTAVVTKKITLRAVDQGRRAVRGTATSLTKMLYTVVKGVELLRRRAGKTKLNYVLIPTKADKTSET